ncbi:MAG: hypothetical protein AAB426_12875 [Myxococcota bacterium]
MRMPTLVLLVAVLAPPRASQAQGVVDLNAPGSPRLVAPFADAASADASPVFRFYANDPQSEDVSYELQIAPRGDFAAPYDYLLSDLSMSGSITTLVLPGGFVLVDGTTYGWRVRANDPQGTNTYGAWSETYFYRYDTTFTRSAFVEQIGPQFAWGEHLHTRANNALDAVELGLRDPAFADDFTSGDTALWMINASGAAQASYSLAGGYDGGGLELVDPVSDLETVMAFSESRTTSGRVHAQVWARPAGNGPLFMVGGDGVFSAGGATATVGFVGGYIVTHASISPTHVTPLVPYVPGEWVLLGLDIIPGDSYDVWVNGERVAAELPVYLPALPRAVGVASDGFGTYAESGTHYFDNFVLAEFANAGDFCTRTIQVTDPDVGATAWSRFSWQANTVAGQSVVVHVQGCDNGCVDLSDGVLPGNGGGFTASPIDLATVSAALYPQLRACFHLESAVSGSPTVSLARFDFLPDAGVCAGIANSTPCDDGDFCTDSTTCLAGVCHGGSPHVCIDTDDNVCTGVACSTIAGACVPTYNTNSCDDLLACTGGDHCLEGSCVASSSTCVPPDHVVLSTDVDVTTVGGQITFGVQAVDLDGMSWVGSVDICVRVVGVAGDLELVWDRPSFGATGAASIAGGLEVCGTTNAGGAAFLLLTTTAAQGVAWSVTSDLAGAAAWADDAGIVIFEPGAPASIEAVLASMSIPACRELEVRLQVVDAFGNRVSGRALPNPVPVTVELAAVGATAQIRWITPILAGEIGSAGSVVLVASVDTAGYATLTWSAPSLDNVVGSMVLTIDPPTLDATRTQLSSPRAELIAGEDVVLTLSLADSCGLPWTADVAPTLSATAGTLSALTGVGTSSGEYQATLSTAHNECPRTIVVQAYADSTSIATPWVLQATCAVPEHKAMRSGCAAGPAGSGVWVTLALLLRLRWRRQRDSNTDTVASS